MATVYKPSRIPCWIRAEIWKIASGASTLKQASHKTFNDYVEITDKLTRSQVEVDAPRTFSNHVYFAERGPGRQRLIRLIYAISSRVGPEIGYVQGMNMVVAVILFVVDDDEDAFWILVAFMENLGMMAMYADGLHALTENLNRLGQSISSVMPNLTAHFGKENLEPFCYGTPWFLTMFAYNLPVRQTVRLYDVAFLTGMGPELIHRFALSFIKSVECDLLKTSFTESTTILKNIVIDDSRLEILIKEALAIDLEGVNRMKGADIEEGGEIIPIQPEPIVRKDYPQVVSPGQEWDSIPGAVTMGTTEALKSTDVGDHANGL